MLWHCWLGGRKGIRPVKNWVVGCWHGYLSGARCRLAYGPANATATHCLASVKSRLVLPFWYWLTQVVPEKGPLNWCVYMCVCYSRHRQQHLPNKSLLRFPTRFVDTSSWTTFRLVFDLPLLPQPPPPSHLSKPRAPTLKWVTFSSS